MIYYKVFPEILRYAMEYMLDKLSSKEESLTSKTKFPIGLNAVSEFDSTKTGSVSNIYNILENKFKGYMDDITNNLFDKTYPITIKINFTATRLEDGSDLATNIASDMLKNIIDMIEHKLIDVHDHEKIYGVSILYALDEVCSSNFIEEIKNIGEEYDNIIPGENLYPAFIRSNWVDFSYFKFNNEMVNTFRNISTSKFFMQDLEKYRNGLEENLRKDLRSNNFDNIVKFICKKISKCSETCPNFLNDFFKVIKGLLQEGRVGNIDHILQAFITNRKIVEIWAFRKITDAGYPVLPDVKINFQGPNQLDFLVPLGENYFKIVEITTSKHSEKILEKKERNKNLKKFLKQKYNIEIESLFVCSKDINMLDEFNTIDFDELNKIRSIRCKLEGIM